MMTRLFLGLTVVLWSAFGLAHFAPQFVSADFVRTGMVDQLSKATGQRVRLGKDVTFQLLPRPAVQVTGFELDDPSKTISESVENAPPLVQAEAITAYLHPWALVFGQMSFQRVELIAPEIYIRRDASGATQWQDSPLVDQIFGAHSAFRSGDNRDSTERGLAAEIAILGGVIHVQDDLNNLRSQIEVPSATISPELGENSEQVIGLSGLFGNQNWELTTNGELSLTPEVDGSWFRFFDFDFDIRHRQEPIALLDAKITGALTDSVLTNLLVSSRDDWRLSVNDARHPAFAPVLASLRDQDGAQRLVLEADNIAILPNGWDAGSLSVSLVTDRQRATELLNFEGQAAYAVHQDGNDRFELVAGMGWQSFSSATIDYWTTNWFDTLSQVQRSTPGIDLSVDLNMTNIARVEAPNSLAHARIVGTLDDNAAVFSTIEAQVFEQLAIDFDHVLLPLLADQNDDSTQSRRVEGSAVVSDQFHEWGMRVIPQIASIMPSWESLAVTGFLEFSTLDGRLVQADQTQVTFDDQHNLVVTLEQGDGAESLRLQANSLDAIGLGEGVDIQVEPNLAASLPPTLLAHEAAVSHLIALHNRGGSDEVTLEAEIFHLPFGRSATAYRGALVRSADTISVEAQSNDLPLLSAELDQAATRVPNVWTLSSLRTTVADATPLIQAISAQGFGVESHLPYLQHDPSQPMRLEYQQETGWTFGQDNHSVKIDPTSRQIEWQKSPVTLAETLGIADKAWSRLLIDHPLAGRGIILVSNQGDIDAPFFLQRIAGDAIQSVQVNADVRNRRLQFDGLPAFGLFPNTDRIELNLEQNDNTYEAASINAPGVSASVSLSDAVEVVDIRLDHLNLGEVIDFASNFDVADALLGQGDTRLDVQVGKVTNASGALLASDVHISAMFSGGRLTVSSGEAILPNGRAVRFSGLLDILGGVFGDIDFELQLPETRWSQGPFALTTPASTVDGKLTISGSGGTEVLRNLQARVNLVAMPVNVEFERPVTESVWRNLFVGAEGEKFEQLIDNNLNDKSARLDGVLRYRRGQWRAPDLVLFFSGAEFDQVGISGTLDSAADTLEVSARVEIGDELAQLSMGGKRLEPEFRLFGTYFGE